MLCAILVDDSCGVGRETDKRRDRISGFCFGALFEVLAEHD